ncbi:MAG: hypothetical protein ASARMPREDX12_004608 [Alectoria sarmentosa]|nr:MAG: hypothetical protein ASARMPREDX12_004608 [Alectoria sarmentosa]
MPIGIQRLNAPRPQPSSRIIFIKPLPGPSSAYALDFLERIAAICHPIMTHSHLSIMTLEEHEPNPEFIGRNFNAGEIIQLVLKAPYTGHWLSFRSVQMVMMHELAHCLQMNHGREFWKVRNRFAGELRELWGKGYTGDGLWGRGQTLLSGEYHTGGRTEDEVLPAHICGGTFRSSRGGKRKRGGAGAEKKKETYAERQQRRIKRKFGVNGVALGGDEETKVKLEKGKKPKGTPRVAGSMRGRELRAAAALARFDEKKEDEHEVKDEEWTLSGSDTESDCEGVDVKREAFDLDGSRMRDGKGRGLVKVCEDEDQNDVHVKQEIEELHGLDDVGDTLPSTAARDQTIVALAESHRAERAGINLSESSTSKDPPDVIRMEDIPQYVEREDRPSAKNTKTLQINVRPLLNADNGTPNERASQTSNPSVTAPTETFEHLEMTCPICSMSNGPGSLLCIACSHVLDTSKITKYWQCRSDACQGSQYINAADCGRCGICGARKDAGDV